MTSDIANVSSIKLAWALCWAAFWTGFPLKLIVAVLLLAMQVPPWEGAGLTALLIVSIPVDLWALGLTARTYFLERHGLELEGAIGLALWWQGAVIGIFGVGLFDEDQGFRVHETADVVDVAMGIVASGSTAQPEDVGHAELLF